MQQMLSASSKPSGQLTIRKFGQVVPAPLSWKLRNAARPGFIKGWFAKHVVVPAANLFGVGTILAELELRKRVWYDDLERLHFVSLRRDGLHAEAEAYARSRTYWVDYGVASYRVVTNNGVGFIVDAFQNLVEAEIMNYHGVGTGTNAEASRNTNTVDVAKVGKSAFLGLAEIRCNPADVHLGLVGECTSLKGGRHRKVGVWKVDVLTHQSDGDLGLRLVDCVQYALPAGPVNLARS